MSHSPVLVVCACVLDWRDNDHDNDGDGDDLNDDDDFLYYILV